MSLGGKASNLANLFNVSLETDCPSFSKTGDLESLPFNDRFGTWLCYLSNNSYFDNYSWDPLDCRSLGSLGCKCPSCPDQNMIWGRFLRQWEEVSTSVPWLGLIPISHREEKSGKHTLLGSLMVDGKRELFFFSLCWLRKAGRANFIECLLYS